MLLEARQGRSLCLQDVFSVHRTPLSVPTATEKGSDDIRQFWQLGLGKCHLSHPPVTIMLLGRTKACIHASSVYSIGCVHLSGDAAYIWPLGACSPRQGRRLTADFTFFQEHLFTLHHSSPVHSFFQEPTSTQLPSQGTFSGFPVGRV